MPFFVKGANNVMANNSRFSNCSCNNSKYLTYLLSFILSFAPVFVFMNTANASTVGGWSLGSPIAQGASAVVNGTKTAIVNGAQVVKRGVATITPSAASVGKVLRGGAHAAAITAALETAEWILDPANNSVVIPASSSPTDPSNQYYWVGTYSGTIGYHSSASEAAAAHSARACELNRYDDCSFTLTQVNEATYQWCLTTNSGAQTCNNVSRRANPAYNPAAEKPDNIVIPIPAVAEIVITKAESGDVAAQAATMAAAQADIAEAETDDTKARPIVTQLENSAAAETTETATGTQTQNPTNPEVTDLALEFPTFCGWAPLVCEAAQKVISFPITLETWYESIKEWMDDSSIQQEDSTVQIQEQSILFDDSSKVTFSNVCPADYSVPVQIFGSPQNLTFSFDPLCQFMQMIRPFVIGASYFIGGYIVMGLSRGSSD